MPVRFTSPRFVGREDELSGLALALEGAAGGRATTLLVTAPAGIGVSRLLTEAQRRLAALPEPFIVIRTSALSALGRVPYGPVLAGLEPLLSGLPGELLAEVVGPSGEELARLMPRLRPRLAQLDLLPAQPTFTSPERRQARVLEGILGLLARLGERRPVVLIVEDLHCADAATRTLVTFLARVARTQRLCLVATYQSDDLPRSHPLHANLQAMAEAPRPPEILRLVPLDRDGLADLIEGIEGERASASVLLLVAERSRGNALFAEEVVAARRELSSASLTGSLEELVMARLAVRSPECRRALRLLAPANGPVSPAQLRAIGQAYEASAVGRLPPRSSSVPRRGGPVLDADLTAGLVEAAEHGFVVLGPNGQPDSHGVEGSRAAAGDARAGLSRRLAHETGATPNRVAVADETETAEAPTASEAALRNLAEHPGAPSIMFRHELVGRAVASDLLPGQRRRHHAALAAALAGSPASVDHWLAAHETTRARDAAIEAASAAESVDAPVDALSHLELALEFVEGGAGLSAAGEDEASTATGPAVATTASVPGTSFLMRAAEVALAAGRPQRAVAYAESAVGRLDERGDRIALGLLYDRLGYYRRAASDNDGAVGAHRRAVEIIPRQPSAERARVLASLAQIRMLDGTFSEAERLAVEALKVARAVGDDALSETAHATTTLGVVRGWGDDPESGVRLLNEARGMALALGSLDELFRAYANLTTVLDLVGRRTEAVKVAFEGIDEARRVGLETVYGNFLRGNAAESLFLLGRWSESRALSTTALEWSPAGLNFVSAARNLAFVEIESNAGELAARLLGQLLLELETMRDAQYSVSAYLAAASFALWRDDVADARRVVERAWERVSQTEDWVLVARTAATMAEVYAASALGARERRDLAGLAAARERAKSVVAEAETAVRRSGVSAAIGSRREADARLATASAHLARSDGRDDPALWDALASQWAGLGDPYQVARARWRQASAILVSGEGWAAKSEAKNPLWEAFEIAQSLDAKPLIGELRELGSRAVIRLPDEPTAGVPRPGRRTRSGAAGDGQDPARADGVGPLPPGADSGDAAPSTFVRGFVGETAPKRADTFGLSPREREVLVLLAQGLTNPEIGRRLFIAGKTVDVHVSRILAKLGVSGRVEAAAVALRLGLTSSR